MPYTTTIDIDVCACGMLAGRGGRGVGVACRRRGDSRHWMSGPQQ
jgi:hypothetical protein